MILSALARPFFYRYCDLLWLYLWGRRGRSGMWHPHGILSREVIMHVILLIYSTLSSIDYSRCWADRVHWVYLMYGSWFSESVQSLSILELSGLMWLTDQGVWAALSGIHIVHKYTQVARSRHVQILEITRLSCFFLCAKVCWAFDRGYEESLRAWEILKLGCHWGTLIWVIVTLTL